MMEFTYDGMVRLGYGFYNPNHAAALICALLPFLWEWCSRTEQKLIRIAPILLTLLLTAALIFTFSRTGIAVMILEALLYRFEFLIIHSYKRNLDSPCLQAVQICCPKYP